MKGLGRRLISGLMLIFPAKKIIEIRSQEGAVTDLIPYSDLEDSDWGYIYERYVGQQLEAMGYSVEMRGLSKGFLDGGIDIVACKEDSKVFIQCKHFIIGKISKQEIEWILYKASRFLESQYSGEKFLFWLVVPAMESSFSKKKKKCGKYEYPIAKYFLSKNQLQNKVTLDIREIHMLR